MSSSLLALILAIAVPPGVQAPPRAAPCVIRAGEVAVEIDFDRHGAVTDARIVRPSGDETANRAALTSAMTWKVNPATRDGLPVSGTSRTLVQFDANPEARCTSSLRVESWTARVTPSGVPRLEATLAPGVSEAGPIRVRWHRFGRQGPVALDNPPVEFTADGARVVAQLPHPRPLASGIYSLELWQGRKALLFQVFEVTRR